jgi:hypothetical protein
MQEFRFLPLSIRLETLGGVATPLVLRGTPLPTKRSETFSTAADQQSAVAIKLLLGESPLAAKNIEIGTFHLDKIPAATRGEPKIEIEFSVDTKCVITARFALKDSQIDETEIFQPPENLSNALIKTKLAEAANDRAADEAELLRIESFNKANSLIGQAERVLSRGSNASLSQAVADLGLALEAGDSTVIRAKSDILASHVTKAQNPFGGYGGFDFSDIFNTASKPADKPAPKPSPKPVAKPTHKPIAQPAPAKRVEAKTPSAASEVLATPAPPERLGKIFGGGEFTLDPQLCFVLMPFVESLQPVYDDHIRPVVKKSGLRCERADEIRGTTAITWDIWERINRSRLLIADLTGQNANVFYELGLAHALGKDVVLLTQSMDFVPFDLKTIRCIVYEYTPRGTKDLEEKLLNTLSSLIKNA